MAEFDYDLFVIGAGSGGVRASRIAAGHGARVAVAEEFRVGGTCVIRGCVPKKLLVYASQFAEELRYGQAWLDAGRKSFDWAALRDFVASDVDRLERAYTSTLDNNKVDHFHERATIAGPNTVRLASGREISAKYILVAVGAWPVMPEFPGNEHAITSNEVFHLESFPKRVVIQGAGYIALEFAGIFNALGAHVTVVNRSDKILRSYDESLTDRLLTMMRARAWNSVSTRRLKASSSSRTARSASTPRVSCRLRRTWCWSPPGASQDAGAGAGKRRGRTGQEWPDSVDEYNATSCPSIYAVGDVTDRVQLTPVAIREGHAFADTVFGGKPRTIAYDHIPSAVFSQPPLAGVGMTEAAARAAGHDIKIYTSDFRPMKNMFATRAERGFYKLIVDTATDKVIGVHMIGPDAPEILQAVAIAVKAG
jgi:glutathione reductase (NADPH)